MQNEGGNYFIFMRCATLGVILTHQLICIWTKRNLNHFHYRKRAISQLRRTFLLTAINLGGPPLRSQAIALLSHSTEHRPGQSPAAVCSPEAPGPADCNHRSPGVSWGCLHCCHFIALCVLLEKKHIIYVKLCI